LPIVLTTQRDGFDKNLGLVSTQFALTRMTE